MSTPDVNEWAWLETILDGIDKDEAEDGWWETSTGAEFGARKLVELKQAIAARIAELEVERDDARKAIELVQTAHESQLTRLAKARAKAYRKIERLQAELEAAQRPPLGYVVARQTSDGWNFLRWYGGPDEIRAGAEQDLANALEEDGPGFGWQLLEVREVPGCAT